MLVEHKAARDAGVVFPNPFVKVEEPPAAAPAKGAKAGAKAAPAPAAAPVPVVTAPPPVEPGKKVCVSVCVRAYCNVGNLVHQRRYTHR